MDTSPDDVQNHLMSYILRSVSATVNVLMLFLSDLFMKL